MPTPRIIFIICREREYKMSIYKDDTLKNIERLTIVELLQGERFRVATKLKSIDGTYNKIVNFVMSKLVSDEQVEYKIVVSDKPSNRWVGEVTFQYNQLNAMISTDNEGDIWLEMIIPEEMKNTWLSKKINFNELRRQSKTYSKVIIMDLDTCRKSLFGKVSLDKSLIGAEISEICKDRLQIDILYHSTNSFSSYKNELQDKLQGLVQGKVTEQSKRWIPEDTYPEWYVGSIFEGDIYTTMSGSQRENTVKLSVEFPVNKISEESLAGFDWGFILELHNELGRVKIGDRENLSFK